MTQPSSAARERAPSVLAVLVVRNAAERLRANLAALSEQSYPRLAVMAVDRASTDGSLELLHAALGAGRVVHLRRDTGVAGALAAALELPVAREADHILLVHDDATLDPDGVARLVEAAVGLPGVENVGVVGAKIVDRDDPRELRDVGRSADRFGHPYSPLQPGEIDQGQFDRVLDVLCVSSAAMLISRDAWQRAGQLDERLPPGHQDLDFCWRVRLAGFRVLMTPLARVSMPPAPAERDARALEDRAALAAMLKNYSIPNLLWLVPLSLALGLLRLAYLLIGRRFEEAYDLVAAWGWNVAHLPGTLSRRHRAQKARRVKDRKLRRYMESAGLRLPRWFQTAEQIWEEQRELGVRDDAETQPRRLRHRTASFVGTHPVVVGVFLGALVAAVALRGLFSSGPLAGGVLPAFPAHASGFFGELDSGFRTTGLGGTAAASPALGGMGALSWVLVGSTSLAQKLMLAGGPALAAVLMYRATMRLTARPGPAVVAATAYVVSAMLLWSFSQGRIDLLVALAVMPAIVERLEVAFGPEATSSGPWRFVVGLGVTFAVAIAFWPGTVLAIGVAALVQLVASRDRVRGIVTVVEGAAVAAILLLPFVPTIVANAGASITSHVGTTDVARLARLAFGPGPGTWVVAAFLPIAAFLGLALVGPSLRPQALRAALLAAAGLILSWLGAAGYLPGPLSNPLAYGALAAVGEALLIAFGLASVLRGIGRESFGMRQVATALLVLVLCAGIGLQAMAAMLGGWAVGGTETVPPAWAVMQSGAKGDFRVLWIGSDDDTPFPPPGGDPQGVVDAGSATVRFSLTDRGGVSALDVGRSLTGAGRPSLEEALGEILSGTSSHGGALLAPFGVRFVVAPQGGLPAASSARLGAQVDLDLLTASGLVIYRNAAALPPAAILKPTHAQAVGVLTGTPGATSALGDVPATPMTAVEGGWNGPASKGLAAISTAFSGSWSVAGSHARPRPAFGWATAFVGTTGRIAVRYAMQWARTLETVLLGVAWAAALWITRKPVRR